MMDEMLSGMIGKLGAGMCRLTVNGQVAVKTSDGYKSYNVKTGRLTNCTNFVFDVGDDFFFALPANKVSTGDIILIKGRPHCVVSVDKNIIEVLNYENMTMERVVPERYMFMGNTYFYSKIVSMMGSAVGNGAAGMKSVMKFMMMQQLFGNGSVANSNNVMATMMPMMCLMGDAGSMFDNMLDGMFDFDSKGIEDADVVESDVVEEGE